MEQLTIEENCHYRSTTVQIAINLWCSKFGLEKEKEEKKRLGQLPSHTPVGSTPVVSPSDAVEGTRDPERAEAIRTCFEQKFQQPSWAQNRAYLSATPGWVKPTEAGQDKQRIGSSFGACLSSAFGKPQSPGSERAPMLVLLSVNFNCCNYIIKTLSIWKRSCSIASGT